MIDEVSPVSNEKTGRAMDAVFARAASKLKTKSDTCLDFLDLFIELLGGGKEIRGKRVWSVNLANTTFLFKQKKNRGNG